MGKIARKSKFWGQLKAKFKKFTSKDQKKKKKGTELWGPNQLKSGIKFKKIPKFSGQLEAKLKKSETKYHF
jgi:hypothetical protein